MLRIYEYITTKLDGALIYINFIKVYISDFVSVVAIFSFGRNEMRLDLFKLARKSYYD